jgi:hypothetical protein
VVKLKYGSWYIGGIDAEGADSIERLQVRLNEMLAEGWEVQHFSMATGARTSHAKQASGFLTLRVEATLRLRGSGVKVGLTLDPCVRGVA